MLVLTFNIPRSKRWLLMKGHRYREEAKQSMQFVYDGNIEEEFEKMAENINTMCCRNNSRGNSGRSISYENDNGSDSSISDEPYPSYKAMKDSNENSGEQPGLWSREYRPILIIGIGLLISQQFSGQPSLLAYSRVLFEAAGWEGHTSVVTVLIMATTSMVTVSLVDHLGRKVLLAACCIILSSSLIVLAFGFWGWEEGVDGSDQLSQFQKQIILWSMFVFIAGYQVGYGPITWCVLSEIYPTSIRGHAMALSVEINFLFKFLIQLLFPTVQEIMGWSHSFLMFASFGLCSLFFIGFFVPETKGMSLEEIQMQLQATHGTTIRQSQGPATSTEPTVIFVTRPVSLGSNDSKQQYLLAAEKELPPIL